LEEAKYPEKTVVAHDASSILFGEDEDDTNGKITYRIRKTN